MNLLFKLMLIAGIALMTGCSSLHSQPSSWVFPPMARPLQPHVDNEIQLLRLTQLLEREELSDDLRAKLFFERGATYDLLGLRDLARLDFEQSLRFNPYQAEVFNMLGMYFTQMGDFNSAYEAFGSSVELDNANLYTLRNQAIALYYGDRIELASSEIHKLQQRSENDPFVYIWGYFVDAAQDEPQARRRLEQQYQTHSDQNWGWDIIATLIGELNESELYQIVAQSTTDNHLLAQRLTEVYFYLGKKAVIEQNYVSAISLFKLASAFNVYEYVENRYVFLELENLYHYLKTQSRAS